MSEIETREGVDLEKLVHTVRRGLGLSYSCIVDVPECEDEHAPAFAGLDALNLITAELRAARTPAQTQTLKDGVEAAVNYTGSIRGTKVATLDGVREFCDGLPVELWVNGSGVLVLRAYTECGNATTDVDMMALMAWAQTQTQTFKDGFAAGLEAAAKVADFYLNARAKGALATGLHQPEGSEDRACLIFAAGVLEGVGTHLATAIRALKEPS